VLIVVCVDVGITTIVLYIIPVADISLLLKLLLSLDTLPAAAAVYCLPTLRVVFHERIAEAWVQLTTRELNVVGGLLLALLKLIVVQIIKEFINILYIGLTRSLYKEASRFVEINRLHALVHLAKAGGVDRRHLV